MNAKIRRKTGQSHGKTILQNNHKKKMQAARQKAKEHKQDKTMAARQRRKERQKTREPDLMTRRKTPAPETEDDDTRDAQRQGGKYLSNHQTK
jgi:hypothetical protein